MDRERQFSSDAVISRISDARFYCLELMLCAVPLGKSPLLPPSFYNLAIDERFEAVFDPTASEKIKYLPVHWFTPTNVSRFWTPS
jgi:hypothetical protein